MLPSSKRIQISAAIAVLLVLVVYLQVIIDPERHQFEPNMSRAGVATRELPIEFALGASLGFREAIAGLLWVRTDEFFHQGNYDAIVPMVRIITWLDPHNVDVYETGAWHLDYNFTDADQRSDRRYIPIALALIKEGIANNPDVPDLYSDIAFTHYFRKIQDYPSAIYWYKQAEAKTNWDPMIIGHGLAHAYEADGQIANAIAEWQLCVARHTARLNGYRDQNDQTNIYTERTGLEVAENNLKETIARAKWRVTQTQPPYDADFSAQLTRIAPMIFIATGTLNTIGSQSYNLQTGQHVFSPQDGTRVEIRLQDADYQFPKTSTFGLNQNLPVDVSILQDAASVRGGKFTKRLDMSRDHTGLEAMYPFIAPRYTVTFWYNPADPNDTPPNVADRVGWLGEGITDKKYLVLNAAIPGTEDSHIPGVRMIMKTITLTRDDIMGQGLKVFQ